MVFDPLCSVFAVPTGFLIEDPSGFFCEFSALREAEAGLLGRMVAPHRGTSLRIGPPAFQGEVSRLMGERTLSILVWEPKDE